MNLKELLQYGYEAGASDLHCVPGRPAMFRTNGAMHAYGEADLRAEEIEELFHIVLSETERSILKQERELETAVTVFDCFRIRVNAFYQNDAYAVTIRLLQHSIPSPDELVLPPYAASLAEENRGLFLIGGEAGSGKSTTAASILNNIALDKTKYVITIESPVEYLLSHGKGIVSQRKSCNAAKAAAVRAAVRQDADVIYIGDFADEEIVSEAIAAAQAGCLVIAVIDSLRAEDAVRDLIESFPASRREEIQRKLSDVLNGIMIQRLLPVCESKKRRAVFEIMLKDQEIRMAIREGRFYQISGIMEKNRELGMQTMDDAVLSAYMKSAISAETAVACAYDKISMQQRMKIY